VGYGFGGFSLLAGKKQGRFLKTTDLSAKPLQKPHPYQNLREFFPGRPSRENAGKPSCASVDAVKPFLMFPVQRDGSGEDVLQIEVGGLLSIADCARDFWGQIRKRRTGSDMHIVMACLSGNIRERHPCGQGLGPPMCRVQRAQKSSQSDARPFKLAVAPGRGFCENQG